MQLVLGKRAFWEMECLNTESKIFISPVFPDLSGRLLCIGACFGLWWQRVPLGAGVTERLDSFGCPPPCSSDFLQGNREGVWLHFTAQMPRKGLWRARSAQRHCLGLGQELPVGMFRASPDVACAPSPGSARQGRNRKGNKVSLFLLTVGKVHPASFGVWR